MIHNASFRRKVIYLGLIALLLIPLYVVGHPAVGDPGSPQFSPGGRLAQLRSDYDLSPAELGEIDPTSESMKLATLGMRGIAANILWTKANEYKMKENWEGLVAVVNQMARLQPNFISVWEFQSHNLSYNISVEQDDYRFRYLWVKKGIEFLIQGTKYNRREPKLYWTLGWYTGQKFGRADENKQFRRLYREDRDFHDLQSEHVDIYGEAGGPDGKPDTWLTSRLWFLRAYDLVDSQGRPIRGKSPHIFYADGPKSRMNYSVTIEEEGYLDEKAEVSWKKSGDEWFELGTRGIPTTWGVTIRLNEEEKLRADAERAAEELDRLVPGAREKLYAQKLATLTPKQRSSIDLEDTEIPDEATYHARYEARDRTAITFQEIAEQAPAEVRALAFKRANDAVEAEKVAGYIDRYRENIAFEYWRTRCQVEQMRNTVEARRHMYVAQQLMEKVEYTAARAEFEKAWDLWAGIMDENPGLLDQLTSDDLFDHFKKYAELLAQLDAQIPPDFKLRPLLEKYLYTSPEIEKVFAPATSSSTSATPAAAPPATQESTPAQDADSKTDEAMKKDADAKQKDSEKKDSEKKEELKKETPSDSADAAPKKDSSDKKDSADKEKSADQNEAAGKQESPEKKEPAAKQTSDGKEPSVEKKEPADESKSDDQQDDAKKDADKADDAAAEKSKEAQEAAKESAAEESSDGEKKGGEQP